MVLPGTTDDNSLTGLQDTRQYRHRIVRDVRPSARRTGSGRGERGAAVASHVSHRAPRRGTVETGRIVAPRIDEDVITVLDGRHGGSGRGRGHAIPLIGLGALKIPIAQVRNTIAHGTHAESAGLGATGGLGVGGGEGAEIGKSEPGRRAMEAINRDRDVGHFATDEESQSQSATAGIELN